jgi:SAM-dependent methyltransferase
MPLGPIANSEMAAAWDGLEGDDWVRDREHYDLGIRRHHLRLVDAAAVSAGERVLDVGCGTGELSRAVGRAAGGSPVLGVDLSARMLARARELADAEGLSSVAFLQADAQVHPFERGWFDVVVSRFGGMFFADPVVAFQNLRGALRPGGRLAMLTWRDLGSNEWMLALRDALSLGRELPAPRVGTPGPFGLADPDGVRSVLTAAGFDGVELEAVDEPFRAGADADDAFAFISNGGAARGLLDGLAPEDRGAALDALRVTLRAHQSADGVEFGSAAWIVRARSAVPG